MIKIEGVSKTYGAGKELFKAVDDVSLEIRAGEMVAIVGHSGSGKTTLLSLIGGLTIPDSGSIIVAGEELGKLTDHRLTALRNSAMGFIYQFSSLIPTLNVLENVLLPVMYGRSGKDQKDARRLLEEVGLADKAGAYPAELSGGQQRRVAIARAFINEPRLILADEPTGDLDEDTEAEIMGFFRHLNREKGTTFVIVTHNTTVAASASRNFRMTHGRLCEA